MNKLCLQTEYYITRFQYLCNYYFHSIFVITVDLVSIYSEGFDGWNDQFNEGESNDHGNSPTSKEGSKESTETF